MGLFLVCHFDVTDRNTLGAYPVSPDKVNGAAGDEIAKGFFFFHLELVVDLGITKVEGIQLLVVQIALCHCWQPLSWSVVCSSFWGNITIELLQSQAK